MAWALGVHFGQEGTYVIGVAYVCYSAPPFQEYFVLWDESHVFFPTCQVRVVRFYVRCASPPSSFFLLLLLHLLRRTSSASSWSQWASPDLQLSIAVGLAGPQLNRRDSARCGPRRTSNGPQQPETKPYRMLRMPKRMPDRMPDRMSEDMPGRMSERMPDRMPEGMTDKNTRKYAR